MAWIYCPNCRSKISAKSKRCYYCGYQIKKDPHEKERKTSNNVRFCVYLLGGVAALIAFMPMLFQSYSRYIRLFVLFIIFLVGYIFAYLFSYKFEDKKQKEALKRWIIKKPSRSTMLPVEEIYYYKGKTNQQLRQYHEALEYYNKSLELNPNFEPAKKAIKEVEEIIK